MILFDWLARAHRGAARWLLGAGSSWIPQVDPSNGFQTGLRSPAGIHLRSPVMPLILRRFQASQGGFRPGWTPKKIALTLAKLRASPASIRSARKGTVKSTAYGSAETVFPVNRSPSARCRTVAARMPSCPLLDSKLDPGWTPESSGGRPVQADGFRCPQGHCGLYGSRARFGGRCQGSSFRGGVPASGDGACRGRSHFLYIQSSKRRSISDCVRLQMLSPLIAASTCSSAVSGFMSNHSPRML